MGLRFFYEENLLFRNEYAWAGETFKETQASVETSTGRGSSARNGNIHARFAGIHSRENDGNQNYVH